MSNLIGRGTQRAWQARSMDRFTVLDSWRGVCALLVVVLHLNNHVAWSFLDAPWVLNFDRFVDFFFVLSGFVIAASYGERLRHGYGVAPFALRRFGRLYPLHIAMLAAVMIYAVCRVLLPISEFDPRAVFDGGIYDFTAIFTNILLLQGIGFENHLTWNYPSWSISAEFYTYLIFAMIWTVFARSSIVFITGLALLCPALLFFFDAPSLSFLSLVQCVGGFAAGVVVFDVYQSLRNKGLRFASIAEVCAVALGAAFIAIGEADAWLAPLVFAPIVAVFAFESGVLSRVLRAGVFVALGALSYSVYMVHAVLIMIGVSVVDTLERSAGLTLTTAHPSRDGVMLWGGASWSGDAAMLAALGITIAVSAATYTFIEKPGRAWGQDLSEQWRAVERHDWRTDLAILLGRRHLARGRVSTHGV